MKNSHRNSIQRLTLAITLSAGLGFVSPTSAESFIVDLNSKTVTKLGMLPGGSFNNAYGINAVGQVAGWADTAAGDHHAFITGPNGVGMTDLGTLGGASSSASRINAAGQVVGYSYTDIADHHAFITGSNGVGMTDLGTLGGSYYSYASDINTAGQAMGYAHTAAGTVHAFIWFQRRRHD